MREHRLLAEVVADQVGQVGVDELVVGDAVADRVGDRHVAGARGVHQARAAEQRVGAEVHRVEELVVDPAVDHVHLLEALVVRIITRPRWQTRSRPSTSSTPIVRASSACSK